MLAACLTGYQAEPDSINLLENITIPYEDLDGNFVVMDKNGNFEGNHLYFNTHYYACADFNTDTRIDMITIASENYGGSGTFYDLILFMNNDGALHYSDNWGGGDRINPQGLYINRKKEIEFRFLARASHDTFAVTPYILHIVKLIVRNKKLYVISHQIIPPP